MVSINDFEQVIAYCLRVEAYNIYITGILAEN